MEFQINHLVGATPPNTRDMCPKCNASMALDRILVKNGDEGEEVKLVTADMKNISRSVAARTTFHKNNSPGGENILTAFTNRYATGLVILDICEDICGEDNVVELEEFLEEFDAVSSDLKNHLRGVEDDFGISRGERLSDGFPVSSGPMKIALKAWIGCAGKELLRNRGLLMKIGALERINAKQFRIKQQGAFSQIENIRDTLLECTEPSDVWGESKPYLGVYLPDSVRWPIIDEIRTHVPDEFYHMMYVLDLVNRASNEEEGWDSNFYAFDELSNISNGNGHPRWGNRYEYYTQLAKRKGERNPEDFASTRMVTNINSTLGGLLGRMKELGLIYPIRSGAAKNVRITPFGEIILSEYEERDE